MAPRKTTTRKKRTTRRKSGNSTTAVLAVGAIVVLGAGALWATSQSKSPSSSVSRLFQTAMSSSSSSTTSRSTSSSHNAPASRQAQPQVQQRSSIQETVASTTVRRPAVNLGQPAAAPQSNKPKQLAMLAPRIEQKPPEQKAAEQKLTPPSQPNNRPNTDRVVPSVAAPSQASAPVAKPVPDDNSRHASGAFKVPKVIVARQALVIREKAWDQAKIVGRVEKGREMRSYAKVGRWHRVVVPSTNILGWVQEDQLAFKNPQNHNSPLRSALAKQPALTTGSITHNRAEPTKSVTRDNAHSKKPHNTGLVAPVYPPQPVGKK